MCTYFRLETESGVFQGVYRDKGEAENKARLKGKVEKKPQVIFVIAGNSRRVLATVDTNGDITRR